MVVRRSTAGTSRKAAAKSDVIDITFDDYTPPRNEYMGGEPKKGVYRFVLIGVNRHTKEDTGNQSIHWMFECQDPQYKGWIGHQYTGLPSSEGFYRTQHIVRALQGGPDNPKAVKLDLDKPDLFIKAAKVVLGKTITEEYGGDYRGALRTIAPDDPSVKSTRHMDEDIEDEDDGFDEEDELDDEELDDEEDADEEDDEDFDEDDEEETDEDEDEDEDEPEDDEDEAGLDEEEDEEPAPKPAARRRRVAKEAAPAPAARKSAAKKAAPAKAATTRRRRA